MLRLFWFGVVATLLCVVGASANTLTFTGGNVEVVTQRAPTPVATRAPLHGGTSAAATVPARPAGAIVTTPTAKPVGPGSAVTTVTPKTPAPAAAKPAGTPSKP